MEHAKSIEIRHGVDAGYHNSNIHPKDREGCVGKSGIDKSFTLEMVMNLVYKMDNKPNTIIKAGPNAKWYLKYFSKDSIEDDINKQKWRNTSGSTMYIIEWDE